MRCEDEQYFVQMSPDDIELVLNAISFEKVNNTQLTGDYKQELFRLYERLEHLIRE